MNTVFNRVKKLADKQGKSINQVEKDLNYSQNTLYRLKRTNPSSKKLAELADYFNVSTDYLLGRSNDERIVEDKPVGHIDVEDIVNNSAILTSRDHALSDEDKSAIRALLTTYLDSSEGQRRLKKYGASEINGENEE